MQKEPRLQLEGEALVSSRTLDRKEPQEDDIAAIVRTTMGRTGRTESKSTDEHTSGSAVNHAEQCTVRETVCRDVQ